MVMRRDVVGARAEVEAVLRLRGAINDAVVFRASVILADALMLEEKIDEAEEMLLGLLWASNLRQEAQTSKTELTEIMLECH